MTDGISPILLGLTHMGSIDRKHPSSEATPLHTRRSKPKSRLRKAIFDPKCSHKLNVTRIAWNNTCWMYMKDPFHTLLDMDSYKFFLFFFGIYLSFFLVFAAVYYVSAEECVLGIQEFPQAFFFSVQTSSTIGYGGDLTPNPECLIINSVITIQTITSLLLDYSILGLVYARFSCPVSRANAIKCSSRIALHTSEDQLMLSLRVTNIRSKQILQPTVMMMLAMEQDPAPLGLSIDSTIDRGKALRLQGLDVLLTPEAKACLWLGLPATVTHIIDDSSPLVNFSLQQMADRNMEVLVLVEGTDAMTSNVLQARHGYQAEDVVVQSNFHEDLIRCHPTGEVTVDYSSFQSRKRTPICRSMSGFGVSEIISEPPEKGVLSPFFSPAQQSDSAQTLPEAAQVNIEIPSVVKPDHTLEGLTFKTISMRLSAAQIVSWPMDEQPASGANTPPITESSSLRQTSHQLPPPSPQPDLL